MNGLSKPISKTVQTRQLKRLKPRHYEILARVVKGQSQRQIVKEMCLDEPWLSIVTNSPIFQEQLNQRLRLRESEALKPLNEKKAKPVARPTPDQHNKHEKHNDFPEGFPEGIIKQIRANKNKAVVKPMHEELPTYRPVVEARKPEPKPEPIAKPVSVQKTINEGSDEPTKRESTTSQVQAARFFSRTLQERIWLVFDYPGEKLAYGAAQQILGLTNGSPWKIYPRSFSPTDGYSCYSGDEIPLLRGKTAEELRALHQKRGLKWS